MEVLEVAQAAVAAVRETGLVLAPLGVLYALHKGWLVMGSEHRQTLADNAELRARIREQDKLIDRSLFTGEVLARAGQPGRS